MFSKTEFDELEATIKKFKRYEKAFDFLTDYFYLSLVNGVVISVFVHRPLFGRNAENWETVIYIGIVVALWMYFVYLTKKAVRKYRVDDDEWARFYTYSILNNLEKFSKTKSLGMKADYRKEATNKAKEFLSCIKKRWKIGTFKLAQDYFGKPISELRKNIQYRVIPNVKEGDDELLGKIEQHFRNFFYETKNLTVEKINKLNQGMSANLPSTEKMKVGFFNSLSNWFSTHKVLKHGMVVSALVIGCCAFFYATVTYVEISREYAFAGSIAVFIGLLTIYSRAQPKE